MSPEKLVHEAVFVAMISVCAWISVPFGDTVITLQTFALLLALFLLPGKSALRVCCVYLLLGAVGVPVFSGFRGGIGALLGPTGGFLLGFPVMTLVYICAAGKKASVPAAVIGLLVCYGVGTCWYAIGYGNGMGWWAVVGKCVLPYLIPDGVKLTLAWLLHKRLRPFIKIPSQT